jgi:hypothetical protein
MSSPSEQPPDEDGPGRRRGREGRRSMLRNIDQLID